MNSVRQHPIVTLGVIIFFAVTALVVFRLSSGAKVDQKKSESSPSAPSAPIKRDLDIRLAYTADITPTKWSTSSPEWTATLPNCTSIRATW